MRKSLDTSVLGVFAITEGRSAWQAKSGGQVRSYTSNVSEVSRVSEVSNMSEQGEQQSLHSLLPLGEGGRRPDEGADVVRSYMETAKESNTIPSSRSGFAAFCHSRCLAGSQKSKAAFTLAEVLITLAIIGVVAVLTIPGLIKNHNEKAWSTAQDVFTKRLEVATRQMNTEEKLAGYANTMDFVNELKKYIKITRVCDNSEITKCFNKQVIWNEGDEPIDMSQIKTSASLGQSDWNTDTVAVQFANGVNAIIAYNPNTTQDPYNNQFAATSASMAILYDVSGNKNPNTNGKDVDHNSNVAKLADISGCMIPEIADKICITQILGADTGFSPMTQEECNKAVSEDKLGIQKCYNSSDYWAGAVKTCGGISNMPSQSQLEDLAKYVYNTDSINGDTNTTNGLEIYTEEASPFLKVSPGSYYFYVWSGQESSQSGAYGRTFNSTSTHWGSRGRGTSNSIVVCVNN